MCEMPLFASLTASLSPCGGQADHKDGGGEAASRQGINRKPPDGGGFAICDGLRPPKRRGGGGEGVFKRPFG